MFFLCSVVSSVGDGRSVILKTVLLTILPLTVFALFIVAIFWMYRRYCNPTGQLTPVPSHDLLTPLANGTCPTEYSIGPVQLLEVRATGRFGCVWKAQMASGVTVAVKVFPPHERQSWSTECNFYNLVGCHENILRFLGSDLHGNDLWLLTEFHEHGSLYDHLKGNAISIQEAVTIARSMCHGLAFLHSVVGSKPIVAHRDFKSRNVLLRDNFTACIADFGLALLLDQYPGDVHGQVINFFFPFV